MCFPFLLKWQDKRPNSQYSDIVHIHLLLSVRDEPRRAQYYRDLLSHIQLVSTLIATIADGPLNIPMLKNVAVLVKNIVECRQVRDRFTPIRQLAQVTGTTGCKCEQRRL